MPLFITRTPAHEIRADFMICVSEETESGISLRENLVQRLVKKLRPSEQSKQRIRHVYYKSGILSTESRKVYEKALQHACRHGNKTIAVSCEDEIAFELAKQYSKRFADEQDATIYLCLSSEIYLTSNTIFQLTNYLRSSEESEQQDQHREPESDAEDFLDIWDEEFDLVEEDEPCDEAIWDHEFALPQSTQPVFQPQSTEPKPHSIREKSPVTKESRPQSSISKSQSGFSAIQAFLKKNDAGFKDTLLKYIDRTGKKDSEIYRKANVDRRLFSKIMNVQGYNPSKPTAIAFAIALELNLEETKDLIGRAGYTLSRASTFDRIIEFFILEENYDIYEINEALFYFDQNLLGC